eukprot:8935981-Pyramimonas_sp.AAC.1
MGCNPGRCEQQREWRKKKTGESWAPPIGARGLRVSPRGVARVEVVNDPRGGQADPRVDLAA